MDNIQRESTLEKRKGTIGRIESMDSSRGLCTFLLMPAHFTHWYLNNIPNPHWATWIFRTIIGSTFQFIFVTLPGMAVILELYNAKIKGIDDKKLKELLGTDFL